MRDYPLVFYVALDGNGVNGLEGMAGMCMFLFNPADDSYAWKILYYDGIAAGHACAINPSATTGFLGNAGQHLLFFDPETLEEQARISTLRFETPRTSLHGSTHLAWLNDDEFITAIGAHFYRFSLGRLDEPAQLEPHGVKLPHAMKLTPSGRYLCYGSMDSPADGRRGEACHVGVRDMETGEIRIVPLPATCWHVLPHKRKELFYAISFRVAPQDHQDYHEWGMAYLKEYVFEIDPAAGKVVRHWATGRETPAHINSDITMSDSELIFCNGGSQSVIFLDLDGLARFRMIDEKASLADLSQRPREVVTQVCDTFVRGNIFSNSQHFLGALRVSRGSLLDSVYGCQLSADQSLLFTANRGMNHISIYNYPDNSLRLRVPMPDLQEFVPSLSAKADPRLGFHHAALIG
ncbi:hypothetical protein KCG44_13510 [Pacificimonas sp. WHA3]|uniref:Uncharacterized protein n=1 Tax=Pacificimonas pallii TaxID=2827236 RepID=A0ABS6SH94_9SPHN|nr:hypothetical protein [Pacificimonas pallii]MBV7257798.1 hypothetical protein [Pacificimonas pallii]